MRHQLYVIALLLFSCSHPSVENHTDETEANPNSTKTENVDTLRNVNTANFFVHHYNPNRKSNSGIARLPVPSDSIVSAFLFVKDNYPDKFETQLTILLLKLYRAHLECCHQSYEIRQEPSTELSPTRDFLVYEFNLLSHQFPANKRLELITSTIGYNYVKSNPRLLTNDTVRVYFEAIEEIHQNIDNGAYWKE